MPDFLARIRVTHPIELVQVTAVDRHVAIADLVKQYEAAGDSVEVMEIKELSQSVGSTGSAGR